MAVVINERDQRTYIASTRLLVTSSEAPYYRIGTTDFVEAPQPEVTEGEDTPTRSAPVLVTDTPDTATLIQAANLYPLLIESDQVELMRERMFGPLAGDVIARAIYAVATPGRFELSDVPVIELTAESQTGGEAIALAEASSKAFIRWISQQQEAAGVEEGERIVVEQLRTPQQAHRLGEDADHPRRARVARRHGRVPRPRRRARPHLPEEAAARARAGREAGDRARRHADRGD